MWNVTHDKAGYRSPDDEWREEVIKRLERGEVNPHGDLDPIYQQVYESMFPESEDDDAT